MKQFVRVTEIAAPLLRSNIDTDQIIPGPEIMRSTDESDERWGTGLAWTRSRLSGRWTAAGGPGFTRRAHS